MIIGYLDPWTFRPMHYGGFGVCLWLRVLGLKV